MRSQSSAVSCWINCDHTHQAKCDRALISYKTRSPKQQLQQIEEWQALRLKLRGSE
ncbi:hypothetical protein [Coleofasciculus sp. FACHB-SPT36]|uniref:hypothetical protein n=1 Tax=Cyanophyceae TaxID=3028117 RepID=UPI00168BA8AA|nr:hypothetical protein [Coleofasciculus sp. FACHB-SPT36]MBD2541218.1 hypothetical protein [Coleofasciculus sp. FACHB-SPT36]